MNSVVVNFLADHVQENGLIVEFGCAFEKEGILAEVVLNTQKFWFTKEEENLKIKDMFSQSKNSQ